MKPTCLALLGAALFPILPGCIANPTALAPVGPGIQGRAYSGADGYLQVFTATTTVDVDFHSYFNPHLAYDVKDLAGKTVRFVANHDSEMDETPDTVSLPPGTYRVVAESAWCGLVSVPVTIERGRTTVVHLDGNPWRPPHATASELVYLPNGEAVGWSDASTSASK
jgi:hypothetical protein